MMTENGKQEECASFYYVLLHYERKFDIQLEQIDCISELKKAYVSPGIRTWPALTKAVALLLAPSPLPHNVRSEFCRQFWSNFCQLVSTSGEDNCQCLETEDCQSLQTSGSKSRKADGGPLQQFLRLPSLGSARTIIRSDCFMLILLINIGTGCYGNIHKSFLLRNDPPYWVESDATLVAIGSHGPGLNSQHHKSRWPLKAEVPNEIFNLVHRKKTDEANQ